MQPLLRLVMVLLVFTAGVRADETLGPVRHAQALLGEGVWTQVIRVENAARGSRYPSELHALVFELVGLLWFYTPVDGTQSFSLHRGNLIAEKADFGPLLRDIEPGFRVWREVPTTEWAKRESAPLPNGCFIESIVALRRELARGVAVRRPRLLSYYVDLPRGVKGHTVLVFEQRGELVVWDAAMRGRRKKLALSGDADALQVARALEGPHVARARELRLDALVDEATETAAGVAHRSGAGRPGV